jgi:MOSC domain-containing protein YiiM
MATVAAALGIEALDPRWLGANMVVEGIPDFSWVPPSSQLIFPSGAGIAVDTQNAPCRYPAQEIEKAHPGHGLAFPKRAEGRRGVVAWVERPGDIALGDVVALHVPPQRLYQPALAGA